nr:hypothetical protein [uncultured bacterium]
MLHPASSQQFQIRDLKFEIPNLVGLGRFELPTSRLSGVRSNQLSYRPIFSFAERFLPQKRATLLRVGPFLRWTRSGPCSFGG